MLYCFAGSSTIVHNFPKADATNDTHAYVCLYVLNIYICTKHAKNRVVINNRTTPYKVLPPVPNCLDAFHVSLLY